jgi:hypothetical protein
LQCSWEGDAMKKFGLFTLLVAFVLIGCNTDQPANKLATSAPTIESFSAYPSTLPVGGGDVTLSWNTTGAAGLWVYPDIQSVTGLNKKVITVRNSKDFTLIATNTAGFSVESKISIDVKSPEPSKINLIVTDWGSVVNSISIDNTFVVGSIIYRHPNRDSDKPPIQIQVNSGSRKIKIESREFSYNQSRTVEFTENIESGRNYLGLIYFNENFPLYKQVEYTNKSQSKFARVNFLNLIKKPKTKLYLYHDGATCEKGKPPISTAEDANSLISYITEIPFEGVFVKDFEPGFYTMQYILPSEFATGGVGYDDYNDCFSVRLDGGKNYTSYLTREPSESGSPVGSVAD